MPSLLTFKVVQTKGVCVPGNGSVAFQVGAHQRKHPPDVHQVVSSDKDCLEDLADLKPARANPGSLEGLPDVSRFP